MKAFSEAYYDNPAGDQGTVAQINRICSYFSLAELEHTGMEADPEKLLELAGLLIRPVTLESSWWQEAGAVLLLTGTDGAYLAALPNGSRYEYWNPSGKRVRIGRREAALFGQTALEVYRAFPETSLTTGELWRFILRTMRRGDVIGLLLTSLAASALGVLIPEITQFCFSSLVPSGDTGNLISIAVLFAGAVITSELFSLARVIGISFFGNKVELALKNAIWGRLLTLPAPFFRRYSSGEISYMTDAADSICDTLGNQLIPTVLSACFSVVYLVEMGRLVPQLFGPAMVIVALLIVVELFVAWKDYKSKQQTHRWQSRGEGMLYQILQGRMKIQIAGAEQRAFSQWDSSFRRVPICPGNGTLLVRCLSGTILLGGTIWFYAVAGYQQLSVSAFIASQSAFGMFCAAVLQITDVTAQITALRPAAEMLRPILETVPETSARKLPAGRLTGELRLQDVYFRYQKDGNLILNHLNLELHPGEYLGIAGTTGCGKSTILRLILGLEEPESGIITFDGIDASRLDQRSIRRQIGTVLQDGRLLSGDILSNITIGAPGISLEEAWAAAEQSGFAEDIRRLPLGMNTILTENGGGLSGGQQQRLLITRALARKPRILILDEATSALDNHTQNAVVQTLDSLGITRIVVAHRLSTLQGCSRIIYLDHGQILEQGTFAELMALNGRFAEQARRQLL